MKDINIAKTLAYKRKEKGITQEELAKYIGVSKASVSKWETGQSYPDITFIPQLATYFNISIDELMDYKPQISKEDIAKLYHELVQDLTFKPYDVVLNNCREIVKKYYSCFPLVLQMAVFIFAHRDLSKNKDKIVSLILEAKELFTRVKKESGDMYLIKQAHYMEASCYIALEDAQSAIELLGDVNKPHIISETLLATAYKMDGKINEAKYTLQVGIYQSIFSLFSFFPLYIMVCSHEPEKCDEILRRALLIEDAFNIKKLLPGVTMELYLIAAYIYVNNGNIEKSINMLNKFTELITNDIYKMTPHGDNFFDSMECWFDELDLGRGLIKNEKTIKQDLIKLLFDNFEHSEFKEEYSFQKIIKNLKDL